MSDFAQQYLSYRNQDSGELALEQERALAKKKDQTERLLQQAQEQAAPMEPPAPTDQPAPLEPPAPTEPLPSGPPSTEQPQEKEPTFEIGNIGIDVGPATDFLKNLPGNIVAGVSGAAQSTAELLGASDEVRAMDSWIKENVPVVGNLLTSIDGWVNDYRENAGTADEITQTAAQFFVPFAGWLNRMNAVIKPVTIAGKGTVALGADMITTFHAFPAEMERLSDLAADLGVENELIDYMVSRDGSPIEERLKNSLEAAGIGVTVGPMLYGAAQVFKTMIRKADKILPKPEGLVDYGAAVGDIKNRVTGKGILPPEPGQFGDLPAFESVNTLRERQLIEKANELGLTEKQLAGLRELDFIRPDVTDDLTKFQARHDRPPTVERAIQYVKEHNVDGQYVAMDIANLGGLNQKLSEPEADKVFKAFTDIINEEMTNSGGQVNLFRHGGDEVSAVVLGVDHQQLAGIMERAKARTFEKAKELGLENLPHTKAGGAPGTGVNYAISGLEAGSNPEWSMLSAHKQLEAAKKRGIDIAERSQKATLKILETVEGPFGTKVPAPVLPEGDPLLKETHLIDTPERKQLRKSIVETSLENAKPSDNPVVTFMGGGGGSGKGTVLDQMEYFGEIDPNAVKVNPDDMKELLPEYKQLVDAGDYRAAAVTHRESSNLATEVAEKAMAKKANIVYDITLGEPEKGLARIKKAKEAGYRVNLVGVTTDADQAALRAIERAGSEGRYVPVDTLLSAHKGFSKGFKDYVKLADEGRLYDNNLAAPRLIAKIKDGVLEIVDQESYNRFVRKENLNVKAQNAEQLYPGGKLGGQNGPDYERNPGAVGGGNPSQKGKRGRKKSTELHSEPIIEPAMPGR